MSRKGMSIVTSIFKGGRGKLCSFSPFLINCLNSHVDNTENDQVTYFCIIVIAIILVILALVYFSSISSDSPMPDPKAHLLKSAREMLKSETDPERRKVLKNYIGCQKRFSQLARLNQQKDKLKGKTSEKARAQFNEIEQQINDINAQISKIQIDVEKGLSEDELASFHQACDDFEKITQCQKIWYVKDSYASNDYRSSAREVVSRVDAFAETGSFGHLKCSREVPVLCQGSYKFYFYPKFIIKALTEVNFEISDLNISDMNVGLQTFIEEISEVPIDAFIQDYSYKYVCKDGTPDLRYSYNPKRANAIYGKISFQVKGHNHCFYYSNKDAAGSFATYFNSTTRFLSISKQISSKMPYSSIDMSESYFGTLMTTIKDFERFAQKKIATNKAVTGFIEDTYHVHSTDGGQLPVPKYRLLLFYDTWYCLNKLGHSINVLDNESLMFSLFASYLLIPDVRSKLTYDLLPGLKSSVYDGVKKLVSDLLQNFPPCPVNDGFHLYYVLSETDKDLADEYMSHIHRFAKTLARANGDISHQEDEWIATLLKRAGSFELQDYDEYFEDAARLVVIQSKIEKEFKVDSKFLTEHLGIKRVHADKVLYQLQLADIVDEEDKFRQRAILMTPRELDAYIEKFRGLIPFAQSSYSEGEIEETKEAAEQDDSSKREPISPVNNNDKPTAKNTVKRAPAPAKSIDKLNDLIGLQSVKDEVKTLTNFIKVQRLRETKGLPTTPISYHCVFTGNPGTGKTTVARIIAGIYQELGLLKRGHLIETDRSGLVADYVGQTATKTNKIIDSALDGVLFVDEAYSLVTGDSQDFGNEAISTLLKRMEDERGRLVVILAGYGAEMKKFIDSNPGLQSRFNRYIHFPDYDAKDLVAIYKKNMEKHQYKLTSDAEECIKSKMNHLVANKDKNFGNARMVRNMFEKTLENQATRLASHSEITDDMLCTIQLADVEIL